VADILKNATELKFVAQIWHVIW